MAARRSNSGEWGGGQVPRKWYSTMYLENNIERRFLVHNILKYVAATLVTSPVEAILFLIDPSLPEARKGPPSLLSALIYSEQSFKNIEDGLILFKVY